MKPTISLIHNRCPNTSNPALSLHLALLQYAILEQLGVIFIFFLCILITNLIHSSRDRLLQMTLRHILKKNNKLSKKTYSRELILIGSLKTGANTTASLMWPHTLSKLIIGIIITCNITTFLIKNLMRSALSSFLLIIIIKIKIIRAIRFIII